MHQPPVGWETKGRIWLEEIRRFEEDRTLQKRGDTAQPVHVPQEYRRWARVLTPIIGHRL